MKVILRNITPNAEINIVEIARVSSSRENKSEEPKKLIKYLLVISKEKSSAYFLINSWFENIWIIKKIRAANKAFIKENL